MHCQDTPFDNVESALEYVSHLLEACREAQGQVQVEIDRLTAPQLARRREAFQVVSYKLDRMSSHVAKCEHLLMDVIRLRRVILEEREHLVKAASA